MKAEAVKTIDGAFAASRILALSYGLVAYAAFFVTILYAIGFVGNVVVAKSIDSGAEAPVAEALLVNIGLLALFAIQHSVMARPAFKAWWTTIVPRSVERSTFVLVSSLILLFMFWQWRPMTGIVWHVQNPIGSVALHALFWLGWAQVFLSTFLIDHFDLFGLRQVYLFFQGRQYVYPTFRVRALYKYVRHPLLLGFIVAFWATPSMTVGHLFFAAATTAYMLLAIPLEERDLAQFHGQAYEDYRGRVPKLLPFFKRNRR